VWAGGLKKATGTSIFVPGAGLTIESQRLFDMMVVNVIDQKSIVASICNICNCICWRYQAIMFI
jgi:hypothetical protein